MTTLTSSKKSLQSFHARDSLWEAFCQHAETMECSIDYLINESMRLYATQHGFLANEASAVTPTPRKPAAPDSADMIEEELALDSLEDDDALPSLEDDDDLPSLGDDDDLPSLGDDDDLPDLDDADATPSPSVLPVPSAAALTPRPTAPSVPPPPPRASVAPPPAPSETAPTLAEPPVPRPPRVIRPSARIDSSPMMPKPPEAHIPRAPEVSSPVVPRPPQALRTPPPANTGSGLMPSGGSGSGAIAAPIAPQRPVAAPRREPVSAAHPRLTLVYLGQKILIDKDQFVIGRGSSSADLTVRDPNISRKHAAVIFHNNAFYIKDLGSTNGVEYMGQRIDSKRIDEGDVFAICGHQFHFTYM